VKAGRVEFKVDKTGNVHVAVGKSNFSEAQLLENARAVVEAVFRSRPNSVRGVFVRNASLSLTMSPPVPLDLREFIKN